MLRSNFATRLSFSASREWELRWEDWNPGWKQDIGLGHNGRQLTGGRGSGRVKLTAFIAVFPFQVIYTPGKESPRKAARTAE
jgi:hypothetical protein